MKQFEGLCWSSFYAGTFVQLLNHDEGAPVVHAEAGEYGQWFGPSTEGRDPEKRSCDFLIVWTMPEHISPSFAKVLQFELVSQDALKREVDDFSEMVLQMRSRAPLLFLPMWVVPTWHRGLGALDMALERGIGKSLLEMNARLCANLAGAKGIFPLNTARWIACAGTRAFQPKLWHMTKNPFGNDVYLEALRDIKAALAGSVGKSKKLVVVDLDETLWGGLVGEVGWQGLRLGGHDYVGEALQDFQRALKGLKNRGVLLAVASKNDEPAALEAIQRHPEMVLKLEDFVAWRINWKDKADNIIELAKELNLGLDAVVFIDDSEHERQRVKNALPDVYVPDWPAEKTQFASHLLNLRCFDSLQVSAEDAARTKMYQEETIRSQARSGHISTEEWLAASDLQVTVRRLEEVDLPRVAQLINKTNQMNLATRRISELDLKRWCENSGAAVWSIRAADRFGDSGLCGVLSAVVDADAEDAVRIVDYVLSCRVIGRKIEDVMLHVAVEWAKSLHKAKVLATHVPSERNGVCLDFWMNSGCAWHKESNTFVWPVEQPHLLPHYIQVCRGMPDGQSETSQQSAEGIRIHGA
jgi:FkbH-like protein